MTKYRQIEIMDLVKIFAMGLVVLAHITRMFTDAGAIQLSNNAILSFLTSIIYAFHMPLYFFVSGYIFDFCIYNGKYKNFLHFFKRKFKRLIIPYIFIGLFIVTPTMACLRLTDNDWITYYFHGILLGENNRHLWYLEVLFFMYLITWCILKIKDSKINDSILLVIALIMIALPLSVNLFSLNYFFSNYLYFVFGFIYERRLHSYFKFNKYIWPVGFLSIILIIRFAFINIFWKVIMAVVGIICSLYGIEAIYKYFHSSNKLFELIKKNCYGIYLFHPMIIYWFCFFGKKYIINPYVFVLAVFILTTLLSVGLTEVVRKLNLSAIIGE